MGKYKQFKTWVRKKLGLVGVGEFVDDAVSANTRSNWNKWFSDDKYLKEYATPERITTFVETISLCEKEGATFDQGKVIDVGCGTGHLLRELKKRHQNLEIVGTDFSEESISVSKQVNQNGLFFLMDVFNIPAEHLHQYDYVICSEVLEHLLYPETALKNILNLANDKASVILTVPNGRMDTYGGHINFWSPESWKVFIEQNVGDEWKTAFHLYNHDRNNFVLISKNKE